jgi:hypothetical protein
MLVHRLLARKRNCQVAASKTTTSQFNANETIASQFISQIRLQVDDSFKRRDREYLKTIFDLYKDQEKELIPDASLSSALKDLGIHVNEEEATQLTKTMDLNDDGGLDFQEFLNVVALPTPIELWARALPIAELVAAALPRNPSGSQDPLRDVSHTTTSELEVSCAVLMEGMKRLLTEQLEVLKSAFESLDRPSPSGNSEAAQKFQIVTMSVGNIGDFHEGLASRIGGAQ